MIGISLSLVYSFLLNQSFRLVICPPHQVIRIGKHRLSVLYKLTKEHNSRLSAYTFSALTVDEDKSSTVICETRIYFSHWFDALRSSLQSHCFV